MSEQDRAYRHHRRDMRAPGQLICPFCGVTLAEDMVNESAGKCLFCHGRCRIVGFGHDRHLERSVPETLCLPRGSIRAMCTLTLSGASWIMLLSGRDLPDYVFGLLLTLIGYYFAFRKHGAAPSSSEPSTNSAETPEHPLYLPRGAIRMVLICGFALCGIVMLNRGEMGAEKHLQFFPLLAALVVGHLWARATAESRGEPFFVAFAHAKGVIASLATLALAVMLLADAHLAHPHLSLGLACGVSFYFGSKS